MKIKTNKNILDEIIELNHLLATQDYMSDYFVALYEKRIDHMIGLLPEGLKVRK